MGMDRLGRFFKQRGVSRTSRRVQVEPAQDRRTVGVLPVRPGPRHGGILGRNFLLTSGARVTSVPYGPSRS